MTNEDGIFSGFVQFKSNLLYFCWSLCHLSALLDPGDNSAACPNVAFSKLNSLQWQNVKVLRRYFLFV